MVMKHVMLFEIAQICYKVYSHRRISEELVTSWNCNLINYT